jgi:glutathione synthase/RimK-type ligase-like ATP-grasp enzyme
MSRVFIIHENEAWMPPFREALFERGIPFVEWHLNQGTLNLDEEPPEGVFYNRMSASAHTRGHRLGPTMAQHVLNWLAAHGRKIVNGPGALTLEVSKVAQYAALGKAGLRIPKTRVAVGKASVMEVARAFGEWPLILKPNRGGKGSGVQLFSSEHALGEYLDSESYEEPVDGTWLVQRYIQSKGQFITRAEFIGGRFHYAVKVDASQGFELCPADACAVGDAMCPADQRPTSNKFEITYDVDPSIVAKVETVLAAHDVEVAGVEIIRDEEGRDFVYDLNTNTNYNRAAEDAAGVNQTGPQRLAEHLAGLLKSPHGEVLARAS